MRLRSFLCSLVLLTALVGDSVLLETKVAHAQFIGNRPQRGGRRNIENGLDALAVEPLACGGAGNVSLVLVVRRNHLDGLAQQLGAVAGAEDGDGGGGEREGGGERGGADVDEPHGGRVRHVALRAVGEDDVDALVGERQGSSAGSIPQASHTSAAPVAAYASAGRQSWCNSIQCSQPLASPEA